MRKKLVPLLSSQFILSFLFIFDSLPPSRESKWKCFGFELSFHFFSRSKMYNLCEYSGITPDDRERKRFDSFDCNYYSRNVDTITRNVYFNRINMGKMELGTERRKIRWGKMQDAHVWLTIQLNRLEAEYLLWIISGNIPGDNQRQRY